MQEFITGQRWINDAELQMGLGTVLDVEHRTLTILFESTGETRTYAKLSAPLTRVAFSSGDTVRSSEGIEIIVETVSDDAGLLSYTGRDKQGKLHEIDEILLDHLIQLSRPSERLFSGQIDNNKWYSMRCQTLQELNRLGHRLGRNHQTFLGVLDPDDLELLAVIAAENQCRRRLIAHNPIEADLRSGQDRDRGHRFEGNAQGHALRALSVGRHSDTLGNRTTLRRCCFDLCC